MTRSNWLSLAVSLATLITMSTPPVMGNNNETAAIIFLDEYNQQAMVEYYQDVSASWTYNTNITDYNQERSVSLNYIV